jgi:hypothetical protein
MRPEETYNNLSQYDHHCVALMIASLGGKLVE